MRCLFPRQGLSLLEILRQATPTRRRAKMVRNTRREFLGDVGRGMLLAGLGTTLAGDLGLARIMADETKDALSFGELEPLVALMQDTPPAKLMAILVEKLKAGTQLRTLT